MVQMGQFREVIEECELVDAGFSGFPFTWDNGREGDQNVRERLDRCLVSKCLLDAAISVSVDHRGKYGSDHSALVISVNHVLGRTELEDKREKKFRFEEIWLKTEGCDEAVNTAWFRPGASCIERVKAVQEVMSFFGKDKGNLMQQVQQKEREVARLEKLPPSSVNLEKKKVAQKDFNGLLLKEELYWRQRSRALWLKDGDKNTSFFHKKASQRQKHN